GHERPARAVDGDLTRGPGTLDRLDGGNSLPTDDNRPGLGQLSCRWVKEANVSHAYRRVVLVRDFFLDSHVVVSRHLRGDCPQPLLLALIPLTDDDEIGGHECEEIALRVEKDVVRREIDSCQCVGRDSYLPLGTGYRQR